MQTKKIGAILVGLSLFSGTLALYLLSQNGGSGSGDNVGVLSGKALSEYLEEQETKIAYLQICGNSSDIVYPELMEATFTPLESGGWSVEALFLDDAEGPYEITQYTETFTASESEVNTINTALYDGLNQTYPSEDTMEELYLQMGFALDIIYEDGTWISLLTLQSSSGHIVVMSGEGTPDRNLLNGDLLEPGSALDGLVTAMGDLFANHME